MADYKDLPIILKLNSKIRYSNPKDVQTTYEWAVKGEKLKTALGQRYIKRLQQIIDGTDLFAGCLICEKDLDNDSVICTSCLNKSKKLIQARQAAPKKPELQEKSAVTQEKPTPQGESTIDINEITQKVKETTKTVAKGTGKAAKEVKNKLSEQMESENVKKAVDKSKKAFLWLIYFWKSLPRKARLIITAILVIFVAFAFLQGGRSEKSSINVSEGKLDKEKARNLLKKTLEKEYPNMEFDITYQSRLTQYPNVFKGKVGQAFDSANSGGEMLPVFTFTVGASERGKNQYALSATCVVTHDGRISASGTLISETNSSADYRIR